MIRNIEEVKMFRYLLGYSPLPTPNPEPPIRRRWSRRRARRPRRAGTLVAAQMQYDHTGDAPVLIRIDSNAGHGAGTPTDKLVDQYADIYSFTLKMWVWKRSRAVNPHFNGRPLRELRHVLVCRTLNRKFTPRDLCIRAVLQRLRQ